MTDDHHRHRPWEAEAEGRAEPCNTFSAASQTVECGHRVWALLNGGLAVAAAAGATGIEHLILQLLRDPSAIPVSQFRAMGLDPSTVLTRLARLSESVGKDDDNRDSVSNTGD
ncbi:hypothetical protein [Nocardia jejuensis]|uniref:hypothetical protein n=1 Tax=Nocardia jejuensis TaxID=328049 RepID=UPI000B1AB138|nr:hypothetical protein [Nocardia jejuensis]